ncbi:MAG: MFS transporter [Acidobacteriota bacterium]|jgi:MFS family permease
MSQDTKARGLKLWGTIWAGQLVSLVGSGLTSFALGIWALDRTGSVTQFALIIFFAGLPGIALAPIAGNFVDKWDRKRVMIAADTAAGVVTLVIAALVWTESLQIWHIYIAAALHSVFKTFQWPAYIAATTLMVPKKHYARVGGMMQFGQAASEIVAPATAGLLMVTIGIEGVLVVDVVTFLFAVGVLLFVPVPKPERTAEGEAASKLPFKKQLTYGFSYIAKRHGLMALLAFFALINFVVSIATVLLYPLVYSFANEAVVGTVMSFSGFGMLAGSILMMVTGGPKRKIHGILAFGLILGVSVFFAGVRPLAPLIVGAVFLMMLGIPVIQGCSQAIWQSKVEPDVQGRVFAVRRMVAQFTVPIADLSAGPLADFLFEPSMAEGGRLAPVFGPFLGGVGEGRGIGLMLVTIALFPVLVSIAGWMYRPLRNIETDLPDAVSDDEGGGEAAAEADSAADPAATSAEADAADSAESPAGA